MIAGFETPDAGRIRFGDQDVTALPANQRNIGFVFQNYALFPHLSVSENVAYGLRRARRCRDAEIAQRVGDVLALVGLAGYEQQFSGQLSGGEQQRVALARAIVIRPRVLLFDEPLSNLDAKLRVQMRQEIRDLQRRLAITTVYVTHDQEEAMAVSDRIAVMNQGSVVQEGTAEDLYHRPASRVRRAVRRPRQSRRRAASSEIAGDAASVAALGDDARVRAPCATGLQPGDRGAARAAPRGDRDRAARRAAAAARRPSRRARSSARRSSTSCAAGRDAAGRPLQRRTRRRRRRRR